MGCGTGADVDATVALELMPCICVIIASSLKGNYSPMSAAQSHKARVILLASYRSLFTSMDM